MNSARIIRFLGAGLVCATLISACSSGTSSTGSTTSTAAAGDKTAFCNDNAILDKASSAVQQRSDLIPVLKANQATINDFKANVPSDIASSADTLVSAANNAIASGDVSAFGTPAIQDAGTKVDAYCGQNADGTPVSGGSTTTTT
jgi:hypothetical protein